MTREEALTLAPGTRIRVLEARHPALHMTYRSRQQRGRAHPTISGVGKRNNYDPFSRGQVHTIHDVWDGPTAFLLSNVTTTDVRRRWPGFLQYGEQVTQLAFDPGDCEVVPFIPSNWVGWLPDSNIYGYQRCPRCGGYHRDMTVGESRRAAQRGEPGLIECSDCGYLEPEFYGRERT